MNLERVKSYGRAKQITGFIFGLWAGSALTILTFLSFGVLR